MTVDNIFTTRFARNPLISRVLTEMELVRELNEGVPRIFEEMKAAGLPEPKIVETTANVTVVLYNGKTAANNAQTTENTTQKTTENATEKTTEKIIRILKERPYATAGQLAEELGLTIDGVGLQYPQTKEARPDCPHRRRQRRSLGNQREIISSVTTDEFVPKLASAAMPERDSSFLPPLGRMPDKRSVP